MLMFGIKHQSSAERAWDTLNTVVCLASLGSLASPLEAARVPTLEEETEIFC